MGPLFRATSLAAVVASAACFSGEATLGSVCRSDDDCGADQACARNFCGLCGDGSPDQGEVCFEARSLGAPAASVIAFGDFDGDGRVDAVVEGEGVATWLRGDTDGFSASSLSLAAADTVLIPGDIDGDGAVDLVGTGPDPMSGRALLGDGAGGFLEVEVPALAGATDLRVDPGVGVWGIAADRFFWVDVVDRAPADAVELGLAEPAAHLLGPMLLNDDERSDAVVVLESGAVVIVNSAEDGGFAATPTVAFDAPARDVWVADVVGDGGPELLAITERDELQILTQLEPEAFGPGLVMPTVAGASRLAAIDITQDRVRDVVVFGGASGLHVHPGEVRSFGPAVRFSNDGNTVELSAFRVGIDPFFDLVRLDATGTLELLEANP